MAHYVLITGGRDFSDAIAVGDALARLVFKHGDDLRVIHGAAPGVDTLAGGLCRTMGVSCREYPADWGKYGKGAGPVRNRRMARLLWEWQKQGHSVEVVVFPGGKGTADMVRVARSYDFTVTHPLESIETVLPSATDGTPPHL